MNINNNYTAITIMNYFYYSKNTSRSIRLHRWRIRTSVRI